MLKKVLNNKPLVTLIVGISAFLSLVMLQKSFENTGNKKSGSKTEAQIEWKAENFVKLYTGTIQIGNNKEKSILEIKKIEPLEQDIYSFSYDLKVNFELKLVDKKGKIKLNSGKLTFEADSASSEELKLISILGEASFSKSALSKIILKGVNANWELREN